MLTPVPDAVIVSVDVPAARLAAAVRFNVAVLPVTPLAANAAVSPVGAPVTARFTAPVKLVRAKLSVMALEAPCAMLTLVGAAVIVKLAVCCCCALTVSVNTADVALTPDPVA